MTTPTQARLKELLHYDETTGIFTWLKTGNNFIKPGSKAGWCRRGYIDISIDGIGWRAHQLAWLYMTGEWPSFEIDHKNGGKSDNRWSNLREATRTLNMQNLRKARKNSATGLLGIAPKKNRFTAQIRVDGKTRHIGSFMTMEAAHAAYVEAKRKLHEGCTI